MYGIGADISLGTIASRHKHDGQADESHPGPSPYDIFLNVNVPGTAPRTVWNISPVETANTEIICIGHLVRNGMQTITALVST